MPHKLRHVLILLRSLLRDSVTSDLIFGDGMCAKKWHHQHMIQKYILTQITYHGYPIGKAKVQVHFPAVCPK